MRTVKEFKWIANEKVDDFITRLGGIGFQSSELLKASNSIIRMKKAGAKIFLTFTSNMVTTGLRTLFSQQVKLGLADVIVTTVGAIEEDIMKATGEKFVLSSFFSDDVELHEKGMNRVGNLLIKNESYERFEDSLFFMLKKIYEKKKRISVNELLFEIGLLLKDEDSILYQAAKNNIPVFCPAITDGAFGFHLYLFAQDNPDFIVDVVKDFKQLISITSHDDKKGVIALGGGVSKHHAIFGALLSGGMDYAVYLTTSQSYSGSMSGATTEEAKSWGKIKDDADATTVIGEVSIIYPLIMIKVFETLNKERLI